MEPFVKMPSAPPVPLLSQANPSWNVVVDEDEGEDDLPDLPAAGLKKDKQIRRRSSKACDQCRKSKCKCERAAARDEPCKNCVLLGTPCTFLGPSRKRGPPKGYIDAIESRLHQMEALLGTLLSAPDPRTRSLIDDLIGDPLARDILARVDESPFGTRAKSTDVFEDRASRIVRTSAPVTPITSTLPFANPSPEWQAHLKERLKAGANRSAAPRPTIVPPKLSLVTDVHHARRANSERTEGSPRQRRRLCSTSPSHVRSRTHTARSPLLIPAAAADDDGSDDEALASAVGQLSLNEDCQVRYHGQVSGLHILGQSDRLDKRNEGGIWRFPKAGVWPRSAALRRDPLPTGEREWRPRMPTLEAQRELVDLFFAYVHPVLPVMHERQFRREFGRQLDPDGNPLPPPGPPRVPPDTCSPQGFGHRPSVPIITPNTAGVPVNPLTTDTITTSSPTGSSRVPTLLLLAMFAVAARYRGTGEAPLPLPPGEMWTAGDDYLEDAKRILNQTYASSRPSTCQALLLLSYREIGIGAMAQAWLYVGMAVRMAQDLGMHRSADKWQRTGAQLFSEPECQVRKRIWYSCLIMDKYVSTYIGRPLSIFERDFDTPYPTEDLAEDMTLWEQHRSACPGEKTLPVELPSSYVPLPTRLISCFNASARLSCILSNIVETIYAVHPPVVHSRQTESLLLEKRLDRWYVELPEHLLFSCSSKTPLPPPHVLTLHMQYWCSVLLLHRPFIRRRSQQGTDHQYPLETDIEPNTSSCKAFDLCAMAATQISNIVLRYKENFCLKRSPAFLTYYVFSAGIMHMTTLSVRPTDVQAGLGLQRSMDALQTMNTIWPSAGRAWELLHGSKIDVRAVEVSRRQAQRLQDKQDKRKRMEEEEEVEENSDSSEVVGDLRKGVSNDCVTGDTVATPPGAGRSGNDAMAPLSEVGFARMGLAPDMPSAATVQEASEQQQQPLPNPHQYLLDLDASTQSANTFPDFARWSTQSHAAFGYPSGLPGDMSLAPTFVNTGRFDSSKGVDVGVGNAVSGSGDGNVWKNFPEHFADPSLITSSLYGLPVMSGSTQGETSTPYLEFSGMYSELSSASGSNNQ